MSIVVNCECGKQLRARDEMAGRRGKCPGCARVLLIQAPTPAEPAEDELFDVAPAPEPPPAVRRTAPLTAAAAVAPMTASRAGAVARPLPPIASRASSAAAPPLAARAPTATTLDPESDTPSSRRRELAYLVLLVAFIPLIFSTIRQRDAHDFEERITQSVKAHPEVRQKIESLSDDATLEDFIKAFPGHKLDGALFARDTWAHWFLAALSAAAFYGLVMLTFRLGTVSPGKLLAVGAFTATAGILLLLGLQWVAEFTQNWWIRGRSIIVLLFYIVKFIGFSYRCATDPNTNFWISFLGFTFGVGLCEELCKSLPILVHFWGPGAKMHWRAACMWGLISGVGFGVSEGITYSSSYYNGLSGADIYFVRFISCVALHAIWSGASAIFIYKHNTLLNESEHFLGVLLGAAALVSIPMVMHGLYDTLLKKDHEFYALITAVVSFAWFAWQVESARKTYDEQERPRAPKRAFAVVR